MPEAITVFISSKNRSRLAGTELTDLRKRIKIELEQGEQLFGQRIFEVWINEERPAAGAEHDATERCLQAVRDADIVLVLFNGDAGWRSDYSGGLGICHAEFKEALNFAPESLRIIRLDPLIKDAGKGRNRPFGEEVEQLNRFSASASTPDQVVDASKAAVRQAVEDLVSKGAKAMRGAAYYSGAPLQWARLNYEDRSTQMVKALQRYLRSCGATPTKGQEPCMTLAIDGRRVRLTCHAVPAAMSVAAARERVGQPFLGDHLDRDIVTGSCVGPVHLIACQQGVTESQALRQLGFPDAMLVTTPFGVWVADEVQRVQMVFLRDCRDNANTEQRCQQLLDWLRNEREDRRLADRAETRAKIVQAMAA